MKNCGLDQVIRREPHFDLGLSAEESEDSTYERMDIGNKDDTSATDKGKGKESWREQQQGTQWIRENMWTSHAPTWRSWTKGQGKGLHLWRKDGNCHASVGFPATRSYLVHFEAVAKSMDSTRPNNSIPVVVAACAIPSTS